jgi:hypothetical protein
MAGQTAHFSPLSSVQKALVTYIACILLSSVAPSCGRYELQSVRAQVNQLEKELLPARGTARTEIEKLWGTSVETHGESFHTESAGIKEGCVPEMVEIDWRGKRRSPNL